MIQADLGAVPRPTPAEDAEADHASLQSADVDVGELLRWEGVPPMFALRDPDGNGLEVVEG